MGTTFIKLGQFLATRPDIIGEKISLELEKLQDKLPAFGQLEEAKKYIKKMNLDNENFNQDYKYIGTHCSSIYCPSAFCYN